MSRKNNIVHTYYTILIGTLLYRISGFAVEIEGHFINNTC